MPAMMQLIPDIYLEPILRFKIPITINSATPMIPAMELQVEIVPAIFALPSICSAIFPAILLLPSLIIPT